MSETKVGRKRFTPEQLAARVTWVRELLDPERKQGQGQLHRTYDDSWCCLGVAGDVLGLDREVVDAKGYLPERWAREILGLSTTNTETLTADQTIASGWNDTTRLTFPAIADRVALATEKRTSFAMLDIYPPELDGRRGDYAREWLARQETS